MRGVLLLSMIAVGFAGAVPVPAIAQDRLATGIGGTSVADGASRALEDLATGEQVLIGPADATARFAGRDVRLDGALAVFGYASDVAYIVVLDGEAMMGGQIARPGRMLLIPPFGGAIAVERFDAARLRDALPPERSGPAFQMARARLDYLAGRQAPAIALGRLQRTSFNVAASGSASQEARRRAIVGSSAIRAIRFSDDNSMPGVVRDIVTGTATALVTGDAERLAQFIDPLPFGPDGTSARTAFAEALIAREDWSRRLSGAVIVPGAGDALWRLSGPGGNTTFRLRLGGEFPFIESIDTGEQG